MENTKLSDFEIYLIDIIRSDCRGYCTHCVHYSPETLCKKRANPNSILEVPQEVCREGILLFFEEQKKKDCGTKQQKTEVKMRENELHKPRVGTEKWSSARAYAAIVYCPVCHKDCNPYSLVVRENKQDAIDMALKATPNYCPNCGARLKEVENEKTQHLQRLLQVRLHQDLLE